MRIATLSLLVCLTALVVFNIPQAAAAGRRVLGPDDFKPVFLDLVRKNTPWPRKDLMVGGFTAVPRTLALPDGKLAFRGVGLPSPGRLGRNTAAAIVLVNGREYARVRMSGDLALYGNVACLTRPLKRHGVLAAGDLKVMRRNITMLGADLISDPQTALGKRLTTSLRGGAILFAHLLEATPLVKRGDLVTIMAQSGPLKVTARGEVRNSGAKGEIVRVKNLMSRRIIHARVMDAGVVEVDL